MNTSQRTQVELLTDMTSGDSTRVWEASWSVVKTRNQEILNHLLKNKHRLQGVFDQMKNSGHFGSDRNALEFALEKLNFFDSGFTCFCEFYPLNPHFDPAREADAGHVLVAKKSSTDYNCECLVCHRIYQVTEVEYHSILWKWSAL